MNPTLYLGLMSGTSMDAVDCALVEFSAAGTPRLRDFHAPAMPAEIRQRLLALVAGESSGLRELGELDVLLGRLFAEVALETMARNQLSPDAIRAIGSHGQTVYHQPPAAEPDGPPAFTLQVADPNLISEITGIATVADFRRRDMAAGGQGAPLVPAFHRELFQSSERHRVVLNLGGIANITLLGRDGDMVPAFDTGPANVLMDLWIQENLGRAYDENGAWAASGHCDAALLALLLDDDYLRLPPPKSTGREKFNAAWLHGKLRQLPAALKPTDVQATLLQLTVQSVCTGIRRQLDTHMPGELIVCGGGARNAQLLKALAAALPGWRVASSTEFGLDADSMEAVAFAWMARKTLLGEAVDLRSITGATRPCVLGGIYPVG